MNRLIYLLIFPILVSLSCSKDDPEAEYMVNYIDIPSPSLKNNKVGVDTIQKARIFFPPSYKLYPNKRYPVLYFIHGYGGSYENDYGILNVAYNEMIKGKINEFFIVNVNSNCKIGGTFCVNSPVTGNWEDNIVYDIIAYIDANFRTIPNKESRGISGYLMGGFGALYLGLKHADIYNLIYAISPEIINEPDFEDVYNLWQLNDEAYVTAYGAAFSPNLNIGYPYSEKPQFDSTHYDSVIIEKWKNGYSYFDRKVSDYKQNTTRIKQIAIDYGKIRQNDWKTDGCRYLTDILYKNNIDYDVKARNDGPAVNLSCVEEFMLPFFSLNFTYK